MYERPVLLSCRDLSIGYDGRAIMSGVTFDVREGDYLCIIGSNGSGKSTLMRTMLGLLAPLSGTVSLMNGLTRSGVGYLPQHTSVQSDFPASVREIVISGCQGRCGLRPFYTREERRLASGSMERMGISAIAGKCFRELSGGQQQRVLLARALCAADRLLFADEPSAGLDPQASSDMYDLISSLNADGLTLVMISHDMDAVKTRAGRVLRAGGGSLRSGLPAEARDDRQADS